MAKVHQEYQTKPKRNWALLCFVPLGWLALKQSGLKVEAVIIGTIIGLIFALIGLVIAGKLMVLSNHKVCEKHGKLGIRSAVREGSLMLVPFTVLAIMADILFGWNTAQPFASAGLMTAGAAMGLEAMKLGGGRWVNLIIPGVGAFVFSFLWNLLPRMFMS